MALREKEYVFPEVIEGGIRTMELREEDEVMCDNCKFLNRFYDGTRSRCQRFPDYVEKARNDWCGEFIKR